MVRLTLLILLGLTLLIACSEKESSSIPKAAPALEMQVIEHPVNKALEFDDSDPELGDQVPEMDISPNVEDTVLDSAESALPEDIVEATEIVIDVADETPPADQSSESRQSVDNGVSAGTEYTVRAGDTLGRIALSQGVSVDSLVRANKLSDKNTIRIGQQLTIK